MLNLQRKLLLTFPFRHVMSLADASHASRDGVLGPRYSHCMFHEHNGTQEAARERGGRRNPVLGLKHVQVGFLQKQSSGAFFGHVLAITSHRADSCLQSGRCLGGKHNCQHLKRSRFSTRIPVLRDLGTNFKASLKWRDDPDPLFQDLSALTLELLQPITWSLLPSPGYWNRFGLLGPQ